MTLQERAQKTIKNARKKVKKTIDNRGFRDGNSGTTIGAMTGSAAGTALVMPSQRAVNRKIDKARVDAIRRLRGEKKKGILSRIFGRKTPPPKKPGITDRLVTRYMGLKDPTKPARFVSRPNRYKIAMAAAAGAPVLGLTGVGSAIGKKVDENLNPQNSRYKKRKR
jgi:hypothetical protein